MLLPVTQETTAMDLIHTAANVFSEEIDVRASVLVEVFGSVGVQRSLRRYEHVRDVLNSWADDRANSLHLVPASTDISSLSASNVSPTKPAEVSFLMYYSTKPGDWDKRLITIHSDGQMTMNKVKDKDKDNICHLSDFDIYTPTEHSMSKKVKPPKKYCFAVKSQQKPTMFESTSTFVHFLCASDKTHANSFYEAVQGWRSWYLVHVMGEGRRKAAAVQRTPSKATKSPIHQHHHQNTESSIGSHYQLGSFKPIAFESDEFKRPSSSRSQLSQEQQQQPSGAVPSRGLSVRDRTHPPSAFAKHLPQEQPQISDDEPLVKLAANRRPSLEAQNSDDAFATSGLLGRSYSTRRREQTERDNADKNPWAGHGLISGAGDVGVARQVSVKRSTSRRVGPTTATTNATGLTHRPSTREQNSSGIRRHGSVDLGRSASTRKGPQTKPLIDLTPQYVPPPQHLKKGKGYVPKPEELGHGTGGLIDAATSGERTWRDDIPEAKDWRGRAANHGAALERQGSGEGMNAGRARSRSRSARDAPSAQSGRSRYASPTGTEEQAFTGGGLLASGPASGPSRSSRNHAGNNGRDGPLLDVSDASNFARGSLLAQVERSQPDPESVIERRG